MVINFPKVENFREVILTNATKNDYYQLIIFTYSMTLPSFKDYLQLHFIVFIWGFTAILGRIVSIPYVELVFYRTLFAVIGLWAIFYFQKKSFKVDKKDLWKFLATGGIIALHWIFFFGAAQLSNVSICLIGMATSSFWTICSFTS